MKTLTILLGVACAIAVISTSACSEKPPTTVCLESHDEHYDYQVPVQVGLIPVGSNGYSMPIYSYIDQDETRTICDKSRPITDGELALWHKEHD